MKLSIFIVSLLKILNVNSSERGTVRQRKLRFIPKQYIVNGVPKTTIVLISKTFAVMEHPVFEQSLMHQLTVSQISYVSVILIAGGYSDELISKTYAVMGQPV